MDRIFMIMKTKLSQEVILTLPLGFIHLYGDIIVKRTYRYISQISGPLVYYFILALSISLKFLYIHVC